jgi:hypothetical protein
VVEVPEIVVHKADEPKLLAYLFDSHVLTGKYGAEIDFLPIEADASARSHSDGFVVERVLEFWQSGVGAD